MSVRGRRYPAVVLGTDAAKDVAVLKIAGLPPGAAPVALGDSARLARGQRVWAIGNAGGRGGKPSVARGRISRLRRSIVAGDELSHTSEHLKGLIGPPA